LNIFSVGREEWKSVDIGEGYTNDTRLEVSSHGRLKIYNRSSTDGKILKGSSVNGYPIVRLKLFKPRDEQTTLLLAELQTAYLADAKRIAELEKLLAAADNQSPEYTALTCELESAQKLLKKSRQKHSTKLDKEVKARTVYFASLVHRMVAELFIHRSAPQQTVVAHIDFDKCNNKINNLKWMTPEENMAHQRLSPNVIADKDKRFRSGPEADGRSKLSITKVMYLKKLLNEGKPIASLAKQFKITETQVIRIKKSENWGYVEAAK